MTQQYQPPRTASPGFGKRMALALVAWLLALGLVSGGAAWVATELRAAGTAPVIAVSPRFPQPGAVEPAVPTSPTEPDATGAPNEPSGASPDSTLSAAQTRGVVLIQAATSNGVAAGTGMVLDSSGQVLTNYHVVAGTTKVAATLPESGRTYQAQVLGFDQSRDVALLQLVDASGLDTVNLSANPVRKGDRVAAVGNAGGRQVLSKASGKVLGLNRNLRVQSDSPWGSMEDLSGLIATNAAAEPGDSGGPMFNSSAQVIGMTTAGSVQEGTSYAVPIDTALEVITQIRTGKDAGTVRVGPAGFLGVQVSEDTRPGPGRWVDGVVKGSPAAKAGVKPGSHLLQVGDSKITENTNLATVIRALEPGERVRIVWQDPAGTRRQATVTLTESPAN